MPFVNKPGVYSILPAAVLMVRIPPLLRRGAELQVGRANAEGNQQGMQQSKSFGFRLREGISQPAGFGIFKIDECYTGSWYGDSFTDNESFFHSMHRVDGAKLAAGPDRASFFAQCAVKHGERVPVDVLLLRLQCSACEISN